MILSLLGGAALPRAAGAQTAYPNRIARIVVPFPPGGATDMVARYIANKLSEVNRQQFVIDNRPGANGSIGIAFVARPPADGYTILISSNGALIGNPRIYGDAGFTTDQLQLVIRLVGYKYVLIVNPRQNLSHVRDLMALARSKPGGLNYGSGGIGNSSHLIGALFSRSIGIPMTHVPFRGGALSMNALVAGDIDLIFSTTPEALPQIGNGLVKPLGILGTTRIEQLPDVPALAETGLDVPELASWMCLAVPRGTPAAIVEQINAQVNEILNLEETRAAFMPLGLQQLGGSVEDVNRRLAQEVPLWEEVIAASGASAEGGPVRR
jgi:tripartite-type tricarboxylate transporter receptor subunit TctC